MCPGVDNIRACTDDTCMRRWHVDDMQMTCRRCTDNVQTTCRQHADDAQTTCTWRQVQYCMKVSNSGKLCIKLKMASLLRGGGEKIRILCKIRLLHASNLISCGSDCKPIRNLIEAWRGAEGGMKGVPGVDPGFPIGGVPTLQAGVLTYDFARKTAWNWENFGL